MWINVRASTWSKKKKKKVKKSSVASVFSIFNDNQKGFAIPRQNNTNIYIYIYDNIVLFNFLGYFFKPKIN